MNECLLQYCLGSGKLLSYYCLRVNEVVKDIPKISALLHEIRDEVTRMQVLADEAKAISDMCYATVCQNLSRYKSFHDQLQQAIPININDTS